MPSNNGAGGTVFLQTSTDITFGAPPDKKAGTPILYTALELTAPNHNPSILFTPNTIQTTVSSPSKIFAPHTYAANVFAFHGAMVQPTVTGIKPVGDSISFTIVVPLGGAFPSGVQAQVVIYQST